MMDGLPNTGFGWAWFIEFAATRANRWGMMDDADIVCSSMITFRSGRSNEITLWECSLFRRAETESVMGGKIICYKL